MSSSDTGKKSTQAGSSFNFAEHSYKITIRPKIQFGLVGSFSFDYIRLVELLPHYWSNNMFYPEGYAKHSAGTAFE